MTVDKLGGRKTLKVTPILEEIETEGLKRSIDIVALFEGFGVKLEKKGSSFMGLCPFHDDKNPSLSVDREKGVYHCFGCGEGGDAIELVKKQKGLGFRDALEYLKGESRTFEVAPAPAPKALPIPAPTKQRETPIAASRDEAPPEPFILDAVAERYARALVESKEARAYLEGRALWNPELLLRFRAGFSDGQLAGVLSPADRAELVRLGVLRGDGSEHLAHCVVFALVGEDGHVAGFYGRRIAVDTQPAHLYLKGPHRNLVNREAAKVYRDSLVLTEAVLDALALAEAGVLNAIPCYGVGGFTFDHERLLSEERVSEVVIAFDADEAGRKGAAALRERLRGLGMKTLVVEPGHIGEAVPGADGPKDWNEWLSAGGTETAFAGLVAASRAAAEAKPLEIVAFGDTVLPKPDCLTMTREGGRHVFSRSEVRYRVAGVRETFAASLRVSVRVQRLSSNENGGDNGRTFVDTVDLYSSRSRAAFAQSATLAGLDAVRVEKDLLSILDLLEAERDERLMATEPGPKPLTEAEKEAGYALLSSPDLMERIVSDLGAVGYVGEEVNKLLMYLSATSRKMADPISVIVSSQSASGKSYLIDTVKALMPEEDVVSMTSLSDQALSYFAEDGLMHKFLVMGEAVHSASVEHQIREMLSAKELSRLVAVKDEKTGALSSKLVRKKVVVSLAMSTTSADVNPENASRCFVVSTDESEEQTRGVHRAQRNKYSLERFAAREELIPAIIKAHHAAQRLLKPLAIVNPYAHLLGFPARMMRTRRDHERFLDLIAATCFLRQFQKEVKEDSSNREYIECDLEDYRIAHKLMSAILPSTLSNFPRSASELFEAIRKLAKLKATDSGLEPSEVELSQREIREATGQANTTVKRNVRLLVEYEYLVESGSYARGARRGYRLALDEALSLVDLSALPSPDELAQRIEADTISFQ